MAYPSPAQSEGSAHSTHSTGKKRRPCDRCHNIKEKCHWPGQGAKECQRCSRLRLKCQSDRPVGRVGRKPKLPCGNRLPLRPKHCDSSPGQGYATPTLSVIESSSLSPSTQSSSSPDIKYPLSTAELTLATRQATGPRPQQSVAILPELTELEAQLLEAMLHKKLDIDKYIIGPSFRDRHQQTFIDHLAGGVPFLKDAFIACASLFVGKQELRRLADCQHVGYKRAAAAISLLRLLDFHQSQDLSTVLILGMSMVTFALHHSGGELLLCRHILGLVRSFYENNSPLPQQLGSDGLSFFICLLGTETVECLVQCRVPTIRVRPGELDQVVDRFIGISAPLLTLFYDLCELSHHIHDSACRCGNILMDETIQKSLDMVDQTLLRWHPNVPSEFLDRHYTPTEVIFMQTQAKVLRLAGLLVTHRLRYAFGTQDAKAIAISNVIRDELDTIIRVTGRSIPFVGLAYVTACLECTDPTDRRVALERLDAIADFSAYVRQEQRKRLILFWAGRDDDDHPPIYWDDIGTYFGKL